MKRFTKLIILLGAIGISISAPLTRISTAPSLVLALYRNALAVLALLPVIFAKHRDDLKALTRRQFSLCMASGVFLALHFAFYLESVYRTSIAAATILTNTQVFFVALIMLVALREKLSKACWLGILLTFVGGMIIALGSSGGGVTLEGNLIALLSAVFMAIYAVIGRFCRKELPNTVYVFLVYTAASVTLTLAVLLQGIPLFGHEPINWLTAGGMTIFCTFMGHSIFSWGLKYETPALVATIQSLEPVFATVLGILLFREIPSLTVVIGGCIVVGGVTLYCRSSGKS
ncbi:MAG: DMT family transporter [Oscillospiraceae bacterium]|nr:DMT family transporter [Oscillospiraceae bacterium]